MKGTRVLLAGLVAVFACADAHAEGGVSVVAKAPRGKAVAVNVALPIVGGLTVVAKVAPSPVSRNVTEFSAVRNTGIRYVPNLHAPIGLPARPEYPAYIMPPVQHTRADVYWLARVGYGEARGEAPRAELAAMRSVLNRYHERRYGRTIAGVARARNQYVGVKVTPRDKRAWERSLRLAQRALRGEALGNNLDCNTFFYNPPVSSRGGRGWFERQIRAGKLRRLGYLEGHVFLATPSEIARCNKRRALAQQ